MLPGLCLRRFCVCITAIPCWRRAVLLSLLRRSAADRASERREKGEEKKRMPEDSGAPEGRLFLPEKTERWTTKHVFISAQEELPDTDRRKFWNSSSAGPDSERTGSERLTCMTIFRFSASIPPMQSGLRNVSAVTAVMTRAPGSGCSMKRMKKEERKKGFLPFPHPAVMHSSRDPSAGEDAPCSPLLLRIWKILSNLHLHHTPVRTAERNAEARRRVKRSVSAAPDWESLSIPSPENALPANSGMGKIPESMTSLFQLDLLPIRRKRRGKAKTEISSPRNQNADDGTRSMERAR